MSGKFAIIFVNYYSLNVRRPSFLQWDIAFAQLAGITQLRMYRSCHEGSGPLAGIVAAGPPTAVSCTTGGRVHPPPQPLACSACSTGGRASMQHFPILRYRGDGSFVKCLHVATESPPPLASVEPAPAPRAKRSACRPVEAVRQLRVSSLPRPSGPPVSYKPGDFYARPCAELRAEPAPRPQGWDTPSPPQRPALPPIMHPAGPLDSPWPAVLAWPMSWDVPMATRRWGPEWA